MKTIIIILGFIFMSTNVYAFDYSFSYEARGLFPHNNEIPINNAKSIKFDSSFSERFGIGIASKQGFDFGLAYSKFGSSIETSDPDIFYDKEFYDESNLVTPLGGPLKIEVISKGQAETKYNMWNLDLNAGYTFNLSNVDFRIYGGVRYSEYNLNYNEIRNNSAIYTALIRNRRRIRDSGLINTRDRFFDMKIKGIGPRLGFSFKLPFDFYKFGCRRKLFVSFF